MSGSCCICASLLDLTSSALEKPLSEKVHLPHTEPCCQRQVCAECYTRTPRFLNYCPYCQLSVGPSSLPAGGLRDPPPYNSGESRTSQEPSGSSSLPSYDSLKHSILANGASQTKDVIHFVRDEDSLASLGLSYKVPLSVLRLHNSIFSDHLLAARQTIAIPASHYTGESLSPNPVQSPEELERRSKLRQFQNETKCYDYELAKLYLKNWNGDVQLALTAWKEDDRWEKANPLKKKVNRR